MKKLMPLAAFGFGYVLGTRAGRERYEQIRKLAHTASKNLDTSGMKQHLETYRAWPEAHSSRSGTSKNQTRAQTPSEG
jgi:hypothetical protein